MNIDRLDARPLDNNTHDFDSQPKATPDKPQQPTYDGPVFAAVHLPTGLLSTPTPTPATIVKDFGELADKLKEVSRDLASPEIKAALEKDAKLYANYVKLNIEVGAVVGAVMLLKEKIAGAGGVASIGWEVLKNVDIISKVVKWMDPIRSLKEANSEALAANRAAHPAFAKLERDLIAVDVAGLKLASDSRRLAGLP